LRRGKLEIHTSVFVLPACRVEIEIGERNPARVSWSEVEKCFADDGIVSDFEIMAVFEDEQSRRLRRLGDFAIGVQRAVRAGSIAGRRNIGVGAGTAAIEDGRPTLIVRLAVIARIIVACAGQIDGVWNGNRIKHHLRRAVTVVVTMAIDRRGRDGW
jgi:hypothetical protein